MKLSLNVNQGHLFQKAGFPLHFFFNAFVLARGHRSTTQTQIHSEWVQIYRRKIKSSNMKLNNFFFFLL